MLSALQKFVNGQGWLDALGDPLQQEINAIFSNAGEQGKTIKNFLNGVWLGHPVHPMITDVPVGAWTCTLLLDLLGSARDDDSLDSAADITLGVGLAAAAGAAVTGLTDWTDTYGMERKLGLLHGVTMITAFLAYTGSLLARLGGNRSTGVKLAHLGYVTMSAGAYLGGDEVYDIGYGVNHTAFQHGPSDFVAVAAEADLEDSMPKKVQADGVPVVLVKQGGTVYALDDTCVHAGCSLAGGTVEGRSIICPCHGSQYDLADGAVINGPATMPEPRYEVRIQDGQVEVKQA